ncbi:MAG TPA: OmpA family protein [Ohtaekwangia sp.]|uniref:OmpA family protein n=1 Tax=Ohtaekwangia sp. TaxID=2066019 RepID=UPI002F93F837
MKESLWRRTALYIVRHTRQPIQNAVFVFVMLAAISSNNASAQEHFYPYYYVVVGGFAIQKNAERFTTYVHGLNYPARYAFNANRKLYYVYVRVTKDKQKARETTYKLRLETEFQKAWIYNGPLEGEKVAEATAEADEAENAELNKDAELVKDAEPGKDTKYISTTPVVEQPATDKPATAKDSAATTPAQPVEPRKKSFVFQLTSSADNKPVKGRVYLLEKEPDDNAARYEANERVSVVAPGTGKLIVVCNLVGYKLAKRAFNYEDPLKSIKGASIGAEQEVIIPIVLTPVGRGDYIELEHVKFFDKSAIMTPASEDELLGLVDLMSNPHCKIRLYGHTSNDASGDIITKGSSENFFALDAANNSSHGSAKELSRQRAEAVKAYLVSRGIAASRIATKGYGAMLAIYENATANDRIEIEIIRN